MGSSPTLGTKFVVKSSRQPSKVHLLYLNIETGEVNMKTFRVWFWDGTYTVVTGKTWDDAKWKLEDAIREVFRVESI